MNIEEAKKYLQNNLNEWKEKRPAYGNSEIVEEVDNDYNAIETLLTAYEKEIEENKKYLVNLTHEQYIKLVEQIRSEINKEWKDKIKAKIEEVKDGTYDAKIVLQSLLEKE